MDLLTHLGFNIDDIRTYGISLVIYKDSNSTMIRNTTGSVRNISDGFMDCLKLDNKEMCDI